MKVHYINILFFAFPLNILVHNQKNHNNTTYHTSNIKPTKTHRTLCECELYAPSNYENAPEMKEVIKNFNRQTFERFRKYDERMQDKRKQCTEQFDKDIQKIILKDKIEKELTEKLATLETKIDTNNIPTCVCEKWLADKMEKKSLKCTQNLGGIVAPSSGVLGEIAELALNVWKDAEIVAAIGAAKEAGAAAGIKAGHAAGVSEVIKLIKSTFFIDKLNGAPLQTLFTPQNYTELSYLPNALFMQFDRTCSLIGTNPSDPMCTIISTLDLTSKPGQVHLTTLQSITKSVNEIATQVTTAAESTKVKVTLFKTAEFEAAKKGVIDVTYASLHTAIIASILSILIIVLFMVLIYLILRYRTKKKMKKKLQYIKLLKE